MARKRNRSKQRKTAPDIAGTRSKSKRRRRPNAASLMFIGIIVLIAVAIAIASVLDSDAPDCPPGQVWSQAHNHCH